MKESLVQEETVFCSNCLLRRRALLTLIIGNENFNIEKLGYSPHNLTINLLKSIHFSLLQLGNVQVSQLTKQKVFFKS